MWRCIVHMDSAPVRACVLPLAALNPNHKIITIWSLSPHASHPVPHAIAPGDKL